MTTSDTDTDGGAINPDITDDMVKQVKAMVPDLSEDDIRRMDNDEVQMFMDLGQMNKDIIEIGKDLQQSADQGGPSSIVGFFRLFMELTKTGVGTLSALVNDRIPLEERNTNKGISRLRLTSILQETVDMTPGEMTMIRDALMPRYERWKATVDAKKESPRAKAMELKRQRKLAKKHKSIDPITGTVRRV